jgi:hypothetical protein
VADVLSGIISNMSMRSVVETVEVAVGAALVGTTSESDPAVRVREVDDALELVRQDIASAELAVVDMAPAGLPEARTVLREAGRSCGVGSAPAQLG